ncbi:hypothetical protein ACFV5N_00770 [Streptomyces sp. NPDC059853]
MTAQQQPKPATGGQSNGEGQTLAETLIRRYGDLIKRQTGGN